MVIKKIAKTFNLIRLNSIASGCRFYHLVFLIISKKILSLVLIILPIQFIHLSNEFVNIELHYISIFFALVVILAYFLFYKFNAAFDREISNVKSSVSETVFLSFNQNETGSIYTYKKRYNTDLLVKYIRPAMDWYSSIILVLVFIIILSAYSMILSGLILFTTCLLIFLYVHFFYLLKEKSSSPADIIYSFMFGLNAILGFSIYLYFNDLISLTSMVLFILILRHVVMSTKVLSISISRLLSREDVFKCFLD